MATNTVQTDQEPDSPPVEEIQTGSQESDLRSNDTPEDDKPFFSDESDFRATKEQHQEIGRGRGKPRKDGTQAGKVAPMALGGVSTPRLTPIPRPSIISYKSDATNPNQRTKALWTYWNNLPSWAKDRIVAYVYRDWPCLTFVDDDSGEFSYIDKISGNEPIQDDADMVKRYGCGSYRVLVNEQPGGTIATGILYNVGGNDLKSFPPTDRRVSDISQIDLGRKENKSYMEFLRMRGLLPEQTDLIREKSDVAQVEAVKEAVGGMERMANKMIEMSDRKSGEGSITNEMIRDSLKTSNEITKAAVDSALKMKDDTAKRDGTGAVDSGVIGQLTTLVLSLVGKMAEGKATGTAPDSGVMAEVAALRAQLDKMRDQQIESLRQEVLLLKTNPPSHSSQANNTLKEQIDALESFMTMADRIRDMKDGSDRGDVAETVAAVVKDDLPPWMTKYVLPIMGSVAGAMFGGKGMPGMAPPGMPGGMPVQVPMPNPPQNATGGPQLVPQPQLTAPRPVAPQIPPVTMDPMDNMLNYVAMPLLNYLADNDTNGNHFGEWVVSGFGAEVLEEAQKYGADPMVAAIRRHSITGPGIAEINPPMPDGRLEKFVGEFLAYKPDYADEPGPGVMAMAGPEGAA